MKYLVFIFTIFFSNNIFSQGFKPLIQTPYYNLNIDLIALDDGNIASLEIIPGVKFDTIGYVTPASVNYYPQTTIIVYHDNGHEFINLHLPETDSTVFWAANMIKLKDGRLCIGGDFVNLNTTHHNLFFAIINDNYIGFDTIMMLQPTLNLTTGSFFENDKEELVFLTDGGYKAFNKNGLVIHHLIIPSNIITEWEATKYSFNNTIYSLFSSSNSIYFHKIDSDFNYITTTQGFYDNQNELLQFQFNHSGKKFKNQQFLVMGNTFSNNPNTINSSYPTIFQIDSTNNFSYFYTDTTENVEINSWRTNLDYYSDNFIYALYKNKKMVNSYIVYCLNNSGTLKWKKYLTLDSPLNNIPTASHSDAVCATQDKGFLFTVNVEDSYGNADVYYYKLDSLGNPIDFNTNIQKIDVSINDFLLYPNPSRQFLNIKTSLQQKYTIVLYNINGKQVLQEKIKNGSQVNISQFTKGIYFYSITDTNNRKIQKGKFVMK